MRQCDLCKAHHDTACHYRIKLEERITKALIRSILSKGYTINISIGDGEEFDKPSKKFKECFKMATAGDEARIYLYSTPLLDDACDGWVYLVFGNSGYDLISDYTVNCDKLGILVEAEAIAQPYWDGDKQLKTA